MCRPGFVGLCGGPTGALRVLRWAGAGGVRDRARTDAGVSVGAPSRSPGACGLIPVGMKQAWLGPDSGTAKWIDMNTPVPKGVNFADDTYFLGPPPEVLIEALDIRDPTSRHLFRMADDDIKVDALRMGLRKDAPKVSF